MISDNGSNFGFVKDIHRGAFIDDDQGVHDWYSLRNLDDLILALCPEYKMADVMIESQGNQRHSSRSYIDAGRCRGGSRFELEWWFAMDRIGCKILHLETV